MLYSGRQFLGKNISLLSLSLSVSLSLSLSAFPFILQGNYVCGRFSTPFLSHIYLVGLPAYFSNHNPFSREHIYVGFNELPSG